MATAKEKFVIALKGNRRLRTALNKAFDDLFDAAEIAGLSALEKKDCINSLATYLAFDQDYDNVHVHWSS